MPELVPATSSAAWKHSSPAPRKGIRGLPPQQGDRVQGLRLHLDKLHQQAKSNLKYGGGGVGGGVSLWPAMDDMRLSREEAWWLAAVCIGLIAGTIATFNLYHGTHISRLKSYSVKLEAFPLSHPIPHTSDQTLFQEKLLSWHQDFLQLQGAIHGDFDVVWSETTLSDNSILALYIGSILTLLYFLVDNMLSKSRLTPARIKVWVSLLCIVTSWTLLSVRLLMAAQEVEAATRNTVYSLNNEMAVLLQMPLDLTTYRDVLLYWRTSCLPPTGQGVLSVLGLMQVQDIITYLQYYSLPVLTAICTPIVKLLVSLRTVYSV